MLSWNKDVSFHTMLFLRLRPWLSVKLPVRQISSESRKALTHRAVSQDAGMSASHLSDFYLKEERTETQSRKMT